MHDLEGDQMIGNPQQAPHQIGIQRKACVSVKHEEHVPSVVDVIGIDHPIIPVQAVVEEEKPVRKQCDKEYHAIRQQGSTSGRVCRNLGVLLLIEYECQLGIGNKRR
jgi:hypothetical protein